jgi:hypothetical protein
LAAQNIKELSIIFSNEVITHMKFDPFGFLLKIVERCLESFRNLESLKEEYSYAQKLSELPLSGMKMADACFGGRTEEDRYGYYCRV